MTVDLIQRIIDTYEQNGDPSAAISWHRRMVQTIDHSLAGPDPIPVSSHVRSYVVAAKWEMGELGAVSEGEEADERVTGAERREEAMDTDAENIRRDKTKAVGNLALANDYLQKAVAAATDETEEAERLLKRLAFLRE